MFVIKSLQVNHPYEKESADEVKLILKEIMKEKPNLPEFVSDYEKLGEIARSEVKLQCKYCWHWNKNSTRKIHNTSEKCLKG